AALQLRLQALPFGGTCLRLRTAGALGARERRFQLLDPGSKLIRVLLLRRQPRKGLLLLLTEVGICRSLASCQIALQPLDLATLVLETTLLPCQIAAEPFDLAISLLEFFLQIANLLCGGGINRLLRQAGSLAVESDRPRRILRYSCTTLVKRRKV